MGGGRGGLPDTKSGGGQSTAGPIYASGPIRKVGGGGGGGGGAIRFRSITKSDWSLGRSPRSFASRDPHHISGP